MNDILTAEHGARLDDWAARDPLLAFDYDGTLAPIVGEPEQATMRRITRALLERISWRYVCAVLSGRALADVARVMEGLSRVRLVGNHGIEWPGGAPGIARFANLVRAWQSDLVRPLAEMPGVVLENKSVSLSIHYRRCRDPDAALATIHRIVDGLPDARVELGKRVVNLLPTDAPDKAAALERLMWDTECATAIFIGDDSTDERVFAQADSGRVLTIRVGYDNSSRAHFYVQSQANVDELLARLLRVQRDKALRSDPPQT